jgi:hypothetical protein
MAPSTVFLLVILCIAVLRVSRRLYRMGPKLTGTLGIEATSSKTIAESSAVGHPMICGINVTMQRLLRLDPPAL